MENHRSPPPSPAACPFLCSAISLPTSAGDSPSATRGSLGQRHRDVLRLEVLLDPLGAALAAEARVLYAAERRAGVGDHPLVEADHAGLQALDDAKGAAQ